MTKLHIVISRCLGFANCRYDGELVEPVALESVQELAREFAGEIEFVPICPELELGLGCPRPRICVVRSTDGALRLVQPATGRDLTVGMKQFCAAFLGSLGKVLGFILKRGSPSCGPRDVKQFYASDLEQHVDRDGVGFFAQAVGERFSGVPVTDEVELMDCGARGRFLQRVRRSLIHDSSCRNPKPGYNGSSPDRNKQSLKVKP